MISLSVLFWMFIVLFGLIGSMRGWARELLVTFAVILATFIISVLERYVPFIRDNLALSAPLTLFWMRIGLLGALVFFGYQTPNLPKLAGSTRFARERLQDTLLGLFLGLLNGYLVIGSVWYFIHQAGYPFSIISAPSLDQPFGEAAMNLIKILPPVWLGTPTIYFAVAIAFAFILVVFL